jgi:hypothetical protein
MPAFEIPDDFRAFMQQVVAYLDVPAEDRFLDAEDALQDEVGYGGRISTGEAGDTYRFIYITSDGRYKWELVLSETAVRDIADGLLIDAEGTQHDLVHTRARQPRGEPLMIWGEFGDDALRVSDHRALIAALDSLHASSVEEPRMLRLWTAYDDQLVAVVYGELCALYVVESPDGYATSTGDLARNDSFRARDHDGKPLTVPYADCVTWDRARNALLTFVDHGTLGPEIRIEGRIPSLLLMMGEFDRDAALAPRAEPPREITRSSLPRLLTPVPAEVEPTEEPTTPTEVEPEVLGAPLDLEALAAWARRLVELLGERELIELVESTRGVRLDEISYQVGNLLQAHGSDAQESIETAEWLANEIGAIRGVAKLFATGGDLQIALRRSRP